MRAVDDWVIDCDTHITEPGDVWTARLPARFQAEAPRLIRDDYGYDSWVFGSSRRIVPVGYTAVAGWPEPFPAAPRNMDEIPAAAHDAKARLAYMDEIGVWACALYPNIGGFGSESFLSLPDPELKLACVRAYNDWLLDWIAPAPGRFIPIMAIPYWDIDAAVTEIERCAPCGHKGICYFFEEHAVRTDLDVIGRENVLFETDYPHPVCLYGNVREKITASLATRSNADASLLLWSNAAKLYGVAKPDRPWVGATVGGRLV